MQVLTRVLRPGKLEFFVAETLVCSIQAWRTCPDEKSQSGVRQIWVQLKKVPLGKTHAFGYGGGVEFILSVH
jgi:hypothetical protein